MKKLLTLVILFLVSPFAHGDIMKDFDSLGGNDVLINRAKLLQPDKKVKVVQDRIVGRRWRNELSPTYANVIGGDAYLNTQTVGLDYHLHINPFWSAGLSYFTAFNSLSKEGRYLIDSDGLIPDVDQPKQGYELLVNFSPIYGKINLFDYTVLHFDVYGIGTYGKIDLKSGQQDTYSVGAGFGLWISQHITSRFELRQRFYQVERITGATDINATLASFSLGYML
ncbi:MAG: outer membrane beta-barrel domain-containing protein [Bdellovibrionales bacterium]|nr:outer membrane beta-barrel domain-containing protein [Bdellovibrionales bacterium]